MNWNNNNWNPDTPVPARSLGVGPDNGLTAADIAAYGEFGIPLSLLLEAGLKRVTHFQARLLGFKQSRLDGIAIPYRDLEEHELTCRLRRDNPPIGKDGKAIGKYLSLSGDERYLYFPPKSKALSDDVSVCAVFVEAEKSALALAALGERTQRKLLPIACGGCYGWRGKVDKSITGVLYSFDWVEWNGRKVIICFDSNAASNHNVRQARLALAKELRSRGAQVFIATIPPDPAVNGPDDLIKNQGDLALLQILDSAKPSLDSATAEAQDGVALLTTDPKEVENRKRAINQIAQINDAPTRQLLVNQAAEKMGLKPKSIEKEVNNRRSQLRLKGEQESEAAKRAKLSKVPVSGALIISQLSDYFRAHAFLPDKGALVLALWALNTWTFRIFKTTPYLSIESATRGCGKTTVLELLEKVCAGPRRITAVTAAALFRIIQKESPTLLIDEAEVIFGRDERAQAVRAIAHTGYKAGATVPRCSGDDHEVEFFDVFCPKAFAAIGGLRGPLGDRCIIMRLQKVPKGIVLSPCRENILDQECEPIRKVLEAYSVQFDEQLKALYANEPREGYWLSLTGREGELWTPLLMHARLAGKEVEAEALEVALRFSAQKQQSQAEDRDVALIVAFADVLTSLGASDFSPTEILPALMEHDVWGAELEHKQPKSQATAVGKFIKRFGVNKTKHDRNRGSVYPRDILLEKLRAHLPDTHAAGKNAIDKDELVKL
jgi:hypothetical protein